MTNAERRALQRAAALLDEGSKAFEALEVGWYIRREMSEHVVEINRVLARVELRKTARTERRKDKGITK